MIYVSTAKVQTFDQVIAHPTNHLANKLISKLCMSQLWPWKTGRLAVPLIRLKSLKQQCASKCNKYTLVYIHYFMYILIELLNFGVQPL